LFWATGGLFTTAVPVSKEARTSLQGIAAPRVGVAVTQFLSQPTTCSKAKTELVLDWAGGHGGETTAMQEQMCYWIADQLNLPWSHRHTIRLHVNGVTDVARQTTFEAVVQPPAVLLRNGRQTTVAENSSRSKGRLSSMIPAD
jgi:hypothetical protein